MSLDTVIHLIETYKYLILFPIAALEGPVTGFIVGMLIAFGYLNPIAAYFVLVMGDLVPDTAYYLLGRFGESKNLIAKYFAKVGITEEHFSAVRALWHKHPGKTMFFSKLAYGLSTPFLISAGLVGMKPAKFFMYALPVTFVQYAVLMVLGYKFSSSFGTVSNIFAHIQYVFAGLVVVFVAYYFLAKYMRTRLLAAEKEAEAE
jgi:membrane protein DedA with SNARE-associated domain